MKKHTSSSARLRLKPLVALAALSISLSAQAASSDFWVDIVNDRGTDVNQQLKRGVNPNAADADDLPALMLAIRSGAWQVYDALLADPRTEINIENAHKETPLMYLALLGETERAAALIARGAQVNRLGWTPLHYAASKGQTETAVILLQNGAMVHAPAPDGTTPLMMAAHSGNRETVQLLLEHGADVTAVNLNQNTAADWARERRHSSLADALDQLARRSQAQREGRPVAPLPAARPAPATEDSGGGSRYFDLQRFENED